MDKPFIFITRSIPEEFVEPLRAVAEVEMWHSEEEPVPYDLLTEKAKKAQGLLTVLSDKIDEELLKSATHLKVIANLAVGFDNIDIQAATNRQIYVCNTPDVLSDTTADLAMTLLMTTARNILEASAHIKENKWTSWSPYLLAGRDIHHKTLGIVGMGKIGEVLAKRAAGFDMNILYHNRSRNEQAENSLPVTYVSMDDLLKKSDFVVCLTPLTKQTKNMFNEQAFKKMKKSAMFINVSRGGVVDEAALLKALNEEEIAAAGLDVFVNEPIDSSHPLAIHPKVVALPHIGSATVETRTSMIKLAVQNIEGVLAGNFPSTIINRELVPNS
ncbi:D-glycerate dehydrogenase [Bacillus sp. 1780r2a1]|nr:D-glycerate dehydrogenase [Bacillus sp. 1780r2a1]